MTYEEFKEQGYTIESVENATVWYEVTINESESASYHNLRYNYKQVDMDTGETELYRIVPYGNNDEHAYEEFSDMEELEEYIKNEM